MTKKEIRETIARREAADAAAIVRTEYNGLGYYNVTRNVWRFLDLETLPRITVIGAVYKTKKALRAARHEFAAGRGYTKFSPRRAS